VQHPLMGQIQAFTQRARCGDHPALRIQQQQAARPAGGRLVEQPLHGAPVHRQIQGADIAAPERIGDQRAQNHRLAGGLVGGRDEDILQLRIGHLLPGTDRGRHFSDQRTIRRGHHTAGSVSAQQGLVDAALACLQFGEKVGNALVDVVDADVLHHLQVAPDPHAFHLREQKCIDALLHRACAELEIVGNLRLQGAAKLDKRQYPHHGDGAEQHPEERTQQSRAGCHASDPLLAAEPFMSTTWSALILVRSARVRSSRSLRPSR